MYYGWQYLFILTAYLDSGELREVDDYLPRKQIKRCFENGELDSDEKIDIFSRFVDLRETYDKITFS